MISKIIQRTFFISLILLSVIGCSKSEVDPGEEGKTGTFTDPRDQKVYDWKEYGTQIWMTENLAYKVNPGSWAYDNDENNAAIYGYLYTWEIAQTIAPEGWHLPSKDEWEVLIDYLGGTVEAYNKIKESGTTHWDSPNSGTNESKFTALPSGFYDPRDDSFNSLGFSTMFHSTTEYPGNSSSCLGLILRGNSQEAAIEGRPKVLALPIRLVKD